MRRQPIAAGAIRPDRPTIPFPNKESVCPIINHTTTSGKITHIFGHRFVVQTSKGAVLADLTPKGIEQNALRIGDEVTLPAK